MKGEKPRVSILVPIYNVEDYIERCAQSVFGQTYPDIDYIFCDDGSTDRSIEVLESVMAGYPDRAPRTRVIRHAKNQGLATTRNTLVDACRTEWLMHVDSDDWVEADLLEQLVEKQTESGADIVVCRHCEVFDGGTVTCEYYDSPAEGATFAHLDYLRIVLNEPLHAHNIWGRLIRRSLYTDHQICVGADESKGEDFVAFVPLVFYSSLIAVLPCTGYFHDMRRPDAISQFRPATVETSIRGMIRSLFKVQDFIRVNAPDQLEGFDCNSLYFFVQRYIALAVSYGRKSVYGELRDLQRALLCSYPRLRGNASMRFKQMLKSNYFLYRSFLNYINH